MMTAERTCCSKTYTIYGAYPRPRLNRRYLSSSVSISSFHKSLLWISAWEVLRAARIDSFGGQQILLTHLVFRPSLRALLGQNLRMLLITYVDFVGDHQVH